MIFSLLQLFCTWRKWPCNPWEGAGESGFSRIHWLIEAWELRLLRGPSWELQAGAGCALGKEPLVTVHHLLVFPLPFSSSGIVEPRDSSLTLRENVAHWGLRQL